MGGRMDDSELAKQIRAERKKRKQEIIARIRFLASCDAERMSDFTRINALIKASMDAVSMLEGPKV